MQGGQFIQSTQEKMSNINQSMLSFLQNKDHPIIPIVPTAATYQLKTLDKEEEDFPGKFKLLQELESKNKEIGVIKRQLESALAECACEKQKRLELEVAIISVSIGKDKQINQLQIEIDKLLREASGEETSKFLKKEKSTSLLSLID